jgi:hypothetical protein
MIGNAFSNTAKIRTYATLTTNASGFLVLYFDPAFINDVSTGKTALYYSNNVAIDGVTNVNNFSTGIAAPIPPADTVLKYRLVSAGLKIVPKVSALNYVATALACLDYGDYTPSPALVASTTVPSSINRYTTFSNVINGTGGAKYDLSNPGQAIYYNWYPSDPYSDIYLDVGDFVNDNAGHEIGGSPRFVFAVQDLPAAAKVDIEMVWNVEYLPNPIAKPWLGYTEMAGMTTSQLTKFRESAYDSISYSYDGIYRLPTKMKSVIA